MDSSQSLLSGSKEEVTGAIAAFEEILDAMPNDRVALQTLFEGYQILENQDKSNHYLARLAQTVAEEQDTEEAARLLVIAQNRQGQSPELDTSIQSLEELMGVVASTGIPPQPQSVDDSKTESASTPPPGQPQAMTIEEMEAEHYTGSPASAAPPSMPETSDTPELQSSARDISAELSLAWNILQAKVIEEEEYSSMVHDLSELANQSLDVPVSVLHVLQDRKSSSLDRVLQFMVKDTNTPYVQLSRFEYGEIQIPKQLPESFLTNRGAVVFETMDGDAMVAILNPYDQKLCEEIKTYLACTCHFFITKGDEYDFAVRKILRPELDIDPDAMAGEASERKTKKSTLRLKKLD